MWYAPVPLELDPPPAGRDELRHDPTFEAWDGVVCGVRDTVNEVVDVLNGLGAGLPRLPGGSLREYLVEPLVGVPGEIRRNAEACVVFGEALETVGGNLARLVTWIDPQWDGAAATGFVVEVGARAIGMRALGALVGRGRVVFDEVADFCERLAVEVERLVVELGELLQRLARRVLSRIAGPLGWGVFAFDIATHGFGAVTDIIDDVQRAWELVETLLGLHDTVAEWAGAKRQQIEDLLSLPRWQETWAA